MASCSFLKVLLFVLGLFAPSICGQKSSTSTTSTSTAKYDSELGLHMCYDDKAICAISNELTQECQKVEEAHGHEDFVKCQCESGSAAVEDACDKCRLAYGFSNLNLLNYSLTCSSMGFTFAPMPSSVVSQQSRLDATRATVLPSSTSEKPTLLLTIEAAPTAPLPTVATTFHQPLATAAASRQLAKYGLLGGSVIAGMMLVL
ncbi:hypothetical protein C7999DRAFT_18178 [Corynascus novoguineensis]|uniref:Uncharacterized protein n=1 Tax=Corynascus novoguineensis TaxID=1126955 RepID=A0AAN7CK02_9PEZI|nr:hypothetical protein C7999DRAFT_18178 [Corynascus novoguineensis]